MTDFNAINLDDQQCRALAQLCKRSNIDRVRAFSASEEEAWNMVDALHGLRSELRRAGFNPR
ncbi:hypothetical protein AMK06_CH02023 [Rhizobium sp. N541]|uniref:DUF7706 family protein n=1 Tax=unclassified Rhizobium TaxID=2613769 RepID=UPI0007EE38F7|nr:MULTISPECIES: hypothetical protein [unclassified Rhizobium]ANM16923.1 hypothetical protein AMK06_CH02023 [Rhizobium sp. N541]ANM23308.1 hypothetical protein AMK07_CH02020 [Rhizobium sp. N941]